MLKKEITYVDYNGVEKKETFWFNLTKSELMKEFGAGDGTTETLQRIVDAKDGRALMDNFEKLILKAYGEKSPDGRRFEKSKKLSEEFSQTPAYDVLFMELLTNENAAAEFTEGILPADLVTEVKQSIVAEASAK